MASIFDDYKLTVDKFEGAIGTGRNMSQIATMFQKTSKEMDEWCNENYGHDFKYVYEAVRQMVLNEYFEAMKDLGYRGNPSALNIINNAIQRLDSENVIKIVFDNNNVKEETEEDKEDD